LGSDDSIAVAGRTFGGGWSLGSYLVPTTASGISIGIFALLDIAGQPQWAQFVAYGGSVFALGTALDHAGNVVVAGAMTGYGPSADAGAGQLADAGDPLHTGDLFLGQFTHRGGSAWSKRYFGNATGSYQGPQAARIAIDNGGVLLAGVIYEHVEFGNGGAGTSGQATLYAARFETTGVNQWASASGQCAARSGDANAFNTARITLDGSLRPLLFGSFICANIALGDTILTNRGALGRDLFISRLDSATGGFAKPRQWGSPGDEVLEHVAVYPKTGNLILTGELYTELDLGDGTLTKPSGAAIAGFVASVGVLP
jgi:hypothetical protein